jgi:hypothetical protein
VFHALIWDSSRLWAEGNQMSAITPTLRPAHSDDASAVRTLVRASYAPWIERFGREPSPMQDD